MPEETFGIHTPGAGPFEFILCEPRAMYRFVLREDITAYELAICIKMLSDNMRLQIERDVLPPESVRHFQKIES